VCGEKINPRQQVPAMNLRSCDVPSTTHTCAAGVKT
jgi:hypothetical protein